MMQVIKGTIVLLAVEVCLDYSGICSPYAAHVKNYNTVHITIQFIKKCQIIRKNHLKMLHRIDVH